ncbi:S8 family peptidase [Aquabacterium sp. NJ1]|uniref:S8 family peptidase n=1 Tax=Aquabacterium sp. NJ1 TaxID=1538295 RepID=UPI000A7C38B0|nr:S8 family peptidase [Aquabacterium sp. NJ1]
MRSIRLSHLAQCVALVGLVSVTVAHAMPPFQPWQQPHGPLNTLAPEQFTDRLVVKYRDASSTKAPSAAQMDSTRVAANRQGVKLSHLRRMGLGADVIKLDRHLPLARVRQLADELKAGDASVEYAEPDRIVYPMMTPSDTYYGYQWDLYEASGGINAPAAWDKATGAGVVVAVVDTGVRPHADLAANLLPGYDFINDTKVSNDGNGRDADASDPGDATDAGFCASGSAATNSSWHGTHVAGTIAAVTNNADGVAGVAFGAKVLPVRALGRCGGYMSDVADGMYWAAGGAISGVPANTTPARVINVSMGATGACDSTFQSSINAVRARGAVVVAAAGNNNGDAGQFTPASCAGVIAVAAVGRDGGKASYSNYGAVVSIAAPGGDGGDGITSTINAGLTSPTTDSYGTYLGTSMATPHVSGVAALMLSKNPSLTPDDVQTRLQASARPFPAPCAQCGAGIVDASAAVDAAGAPSMLATTIVEVEPNNSISTAQVIPSAPMQVNGFLASSSDVDYYKFSLPGGKRLSITLMPNSTANANLYVYNLAGRLLASSIKGTGKVENVTITNATGGSNTLSIRVVYGGGTTGAVAGSYVMLLNY